jgi:hypothetical protein
VLAKSNFENQNFEIRDIKNRERIPDQGRLERQYFSFGIVSSCGFRASNLLAEAFPALPFSSVC